MTDRKEVLELVKWVNENTQDAASVEYDEQGYIDSVFYRGHNKMIELSPLSFAEIVRTKRASTKELSVQAVVSLRMT